MKAREFPKVQVAYTTRIVNDVEVGRWVLSTTIGDVNNGATLMLVIKHDLSGEDDQYTREVWFDMGDHVRVLPNDDFDTWKQNFIDHEGQQAWDHFVSQTSFGSGNRVRGGVADAFFRSIVGYSVTERFDAMVEHWELLNKMASFSIT